MDRKSIFVIVTCAALLMVWQFVIVPKYWPYKPPPPQTNALEAAQSPGQTSAVVPSLTASTNGAMPRLAVNTNVQEELLVVTNQNARYTFTSYGGGLKL